MDANTQKSHLSRLSTRGLYVTSLFFFMCYVVLFPGATITVALDRVPAWGTSFGGVLLLLQGAAVLCWLGHRSGWRGMRTGCVVGTLAGTVEYIGVTTGFPFGHYRYTDILQPQLFGVVPLAICAAWIMVIPSSIELATMITPHRWSRRAILLVAATLVLLLDLQIETVATRINHYWVWQANGRYYSVPFANFAAWWLVGLGLAWLVGRGAGAVQQNKRFVDPLPVVQQWIPHLLYFLSTLMFTVTNLAYGYTVPGFVGVAVLAAVGLLWLRCAPLRLVLGNKRGAESSRTSPQ